MHGRSGRSSPPSLVTLTDTVMLISQTKLGGELLPERRMHVVREKLTVRPSQPSLRIVTDIE